MGNVPRPDAFGMRLHELEDLGRTLTKISGGPSIDDRLAGGLEVSTIQGPSAGIERDGVLRLGHFSAGHGQHTVRPGTRTVDHDRGVGGARQPVSTTHIVQEVVRGCLAVVVHQDHCGAGLVVNERLQHGHLGVVVLVL
ncbi:MAG: hypothetical protein ACR2P2_10885 [Nakamurella sp.]